MLIDFYPIPFTNKYLISKKGELWSVKRQCKIACNSRFGQYVRVALYINGKPKRFLLHRLVLISFSPSSNKSLHVNHKNGIKSDNRLQNLEWVNRSQNMQHAKNMGLLNIKKGTANHLHCKNHKGSNNPAKKLDTQKVEQIRLILKNQEFKPKHIAEMFNISVHTVNAIKYNKIWKD